MKFKFKVTLYTSRINPYVEVTEVFEVEVSTKITANVIFSETKDYTNSTIESKSKFDVDLNDENYDYKLYIRDANGTIDLQSEELDEEEEITLYGLFKEAEISYFK